MEGEGLGICRYEYETRKISFIYWVPISTILCCVVSDMASTSESLLLVIHDEYIRPIILQVYETELYLSCI